MRALFPNSNFLFVRLSTQIGLVAASVCRTTEEIGKKESTKCNDGDKQMSRFLCCFIRKYGNRLLFLIVQIEDNIWNWGNCLPNQTFILVAIPTQFHFIFVLSVLFKSISPYLHFTTSGSLHQSTQRLTKTTSKMLSMRTFAYRLYLFFVEV